MNLTSLAPHLLYQFKDEKQLCNDIEKLSEHFTSKRDKISDYLADKRLVSAYTAFYLTTNYPKFAHMMALLESYKEVFKDAQWIDIGCGPGTFLFAMHDYLKGKYEKSWGIESSVFMRDQAKAIQTGLYPQAPIEFVPDVKKITKKGAAKRIVLFTHSLNEMGNNTALNYLNELEPDLIVLVEPGTKDFFEQFLNFRQSMIHKGYNCLYPCHSNEACPLDPKKDWCHQYFKVKHNLEVSRLTQLVHKNRKWLPISLSLFANKELERKDTKMATIVRTFPSTKFSFEWEVCFEQNNTNKVIHIQIMKRKMNKSWIKKKEETLAGERVKFEVIKDLGDNRFRVQLLEQDV